MIAVFINTGVLRCPAKQGNHKHKLDHDLHTNVQGLKVGHIRTCPEKSESAGFRLSRLLSLSAVA